MLPPDQIRSRLVPALLTVICVISLGLEATRWGFKESTIVEAAPAPAAVVSTNNFYATGPLKVHPTNARYFADKSGQAILLSGSHTWASLVDGAPPRFSFEKYLDMLQAYQHNFIRLWTWEHAYVLRPTGERFEFDPLPYARVGPGLASDGQPKFDLTQWNREYFERLRARVIEARDRGMYVSIMLFEGWADNGNDWSTHDKSFRAWNAHPFNPSNNINGINGDLNGDGIGFEVHTLNVPAVTAIQEAYVRRIVDTVNDLDNVLYEIANEGRALSVEWQYHMINMVKLYQASKPKQHPVGMTAPAWGAGNSALWASKADWVSPDYEDGYRDSPPASLGNKVILTDTDHLWGIGGDHAWVWMSFTRGLNPIYMDPFGREGHPQANELVRKNMGYALSYSRRMDLAKAIPRGALSSSGYCLTNPSTEYLIYVPSRTGWFHSLKMLAILFRNKVTVDLTRTAGALEVEWFNPVTGETVPSGSVAGGAVVQFIAPFSGEAVLYIYRSDRK
jgi:hypothetical protein